MATTSLWAVKGALSDIVSYIENPQKTQVDDLKNVLHYAQDEHKTEKQYLVTGINCLAQTAYNQMTNTKKKFGKMNGYVAFHGYQSFKAGEVTPKQCHEIGIQYAKQLWGNKYEVLVATHVNTDCCHNHFVLNSVSFRDGKKFVYGKYDFLELQRVSDQICRNNGLSVIENKQGKTPRKIFMDEKAGKPTKYNLMRAAIDDAISKSSTQRDFFEYLKRNGYQIDCRPSIKHPTIIRIGDAKNTRLYQLGEGYLPERIAEKISQNPIGLAEWRYQKPRNIAPQKMNFRGSLQNPKKLCGLQALHIYYCYRLGLLPKGKPHKPLSPQMKEELRHLDRLSAQCKLIATKNLSTDVDVKNLVASNSVQIDNLILQRNHYRNLLRHCNPEEITQIKAERDSLTQQISIFRKENKVAESITVNVPKMKEQLKIEEQMLAEKRSRDYKKAKENRGLAR